MPTILLFVADCSIRAVKAKVRSPNSDRGFGMKKLLADEERFHCLVATTVTRMNSLVSQSTCVCCIHT